MTIEYWPETAEKTEWFSPETIPEQIGVYQKECPLIGLDIVYSHWDGIRWSAFAYSITACLKLSYIETVYDDIRWRGLKEPVVLKK